MTKNNDDERHGRNGTKAVKKCAYIEKKQRRRRITSRREIIAVAPVVLKGALIRESSGLVDAFTRLYDRTGYSTYRPQDGVDLDYSGTGSTSANGDYGENESSQMGLSRVKEMKVVSRTPMVIIYTWLLAY